jgi:hypothetical protein
MLRVCAEEAVKKQRGKERRKKKIAVFAAWCRAELLRKANGREFTNSNPAAEKFAEAHEAHWKNLFADSGRKGLQGGEGSGYFD